VQAHAVNDHAAARCCYEASLEHKDNPWALRGLALLDLADDAVDSAAGRYERAHRYLPQLGPLAQEAIQTLLQAHRPDDALKILDALPSPLRARGRFQMLEAQAAAAAGQLQRARVLLDGGVVVDDLREGETTLSDLWVSLYPGTPVPGRYDFRMTPAKADERNVKTFDASVDPTS
jgi:predicted Zn-dependent protease